MKKIYFTLAFVVFSCLFFSKANAQQTMDGWNIDVGPRFALPIRYLGMVSSFGVGADGSITKPIIDGLSLGGRVNASYFFGTTD